MHRHALLAVAAALIAFQAPEASAGKAKVHLYIGVHPLDADTFCYIEAPHQHPAAPKHAKVQFRVHDGYHHFVGDPVAYGWEGDQHAYYGHHPVQVDVVLGPWARYPHGDEYCYLDGPHYHHYEPVGEAKFVLKGDAYWYVGTLPPRYKKERPRYKRINRVYADVEYVRPVVVVEPPPGYVGVVVDGPAVGVRAEVVGGVEVVIPEPVVEVELGLGIGGHVHHGHRKHKKHRKHRKHRKHKKYRRGGYFRRYKRRH